MRAVIQRVSSARVSCTGRTLGEIGPGLLVLLGVARQDTEADAVWLAEKIANLRIFPDASGHMNRSVLDTGGRILVVSQFTLLADMRKGTRPSFNAAAPPAVAIPLYGDFVRRLTARLSRPVATGEFGAMMQVELVNDGPVTLVLDSPAGGAPASTS